MLQKSVFSSISQIPHFPDIWTETTRTQARTIGLEAVAPVAHVAVVPEVRVVPEDPRVHVEDLEKHQNRRQKPTIFNSQSRHLIRTTTMMEWCSWTGSSSTWPIRRRRHGLHGKRKHQRLLKKRRHLEQKTSCVTVRNQLRPSSKSSRKRVRTREKSFTRARCHSRVTRNATFSNGSNSELRIDLLIFF